MTECYRCGQEGHRAGECGASLADPPLRHDSLVMFRRPAHEIADAHAWAEKIRQQLGWTENADD